MFHKCFKKVRIRSGNRKTHGDETIQKKLSAQTALKMKLLNNKCKETEESTKNKLKEIENDLVEETVNKNVKTVKDHLKQIESEEGNFLNLGFWKLKQKLRPNSKDPPMAKNDKDGNLITSPEGIKSLYLEAYKTRLKHREMKPELFDLYLLKTELWLSRQEYLKDKKSKLLEYG